MVVVNNTFWRLEPFDRTDPASMTAYPGLTAPAELLVKLKRRDGIVVAEWDDAAEHGRVHALGIVQQVDGQSAVVDWRRANFIVRPTGQGATQWRKRSFFEFAKLVAERYRLMDHFLDTFDNPDTGTHSPRSRPDEVPTPLVETPVPQRSTPTAVTIPSSGAPSGQRNRVAPNGEIFATQQRGLFMGNRTSPPRWLICDLHFQRNLKEPRKYTKLFFLDEAVALAAGHRPCNTCRPDRLRAYLAAMGSEISVSGAGDLDAVLNRAHRGQRERSRIASLPDGAFVELGDGDYRLKWAGVMHRWTPGGYVDAASPAELGDDEVAVLTPEPSLAALRNGYTAVVHPSAGGR